jgi:hypothetical protein
MSVKFLICSIFVITAVLSGCSESKKPSLSAAPASSSVSPYSSAPDQGAKDARDVARLYNTTEQHVNDTVSRAAQLGGTSNEKMMEALKAARGE